MRSRSTRSLIGGLAAAIAAVGVQAVTISPASAICSDNECTGKQPDVQNCDTNATTDWIQYINVDDLSFALRRSARCDSAWGRIVDNRPNPSACDLYYVIRISSRRWVETRGEYVIESRQTFKETNSRRCNGMIDWTAMVGSNGTQEKLDYGYLTGDGIHWQGNSGWRA